MDEKISYLAKQILTTVPKDDVEELIAVLRYFNTYFDGSNRSLAMEQGSVDFPNKDIQVERYVQNSLNAGRYSARSYITSNSNVCRLCGK